MKPDKPDLGHISTFCSTQNLKLIRDFVSTTLRKKKEVAEADQQMIVLAVDEICANSMLHANFSNPNDSIDVFLQYNQGEVVVEIVDKGIYFNYENYTEPSLEDLMHNKVKGSMGLMLVRKIMDKIEYSRVQDMNVCRMVKKLTNTIN